MSVSVVTVGTKDGANATPYSFNFAAGAAATVVYVAVAYDGNAVIPITVSYDGVDMGTALEITDQEPVHVFRTINPPTGSVVVEVSTGGFIGGSGAIAVSCSGINTATPNGTPVKTSSASDASSSVNVASMAANDLILSFVAVNADPSDVNPSGAGQTELADFYFGNPAHPSGGTVAACSQTGTGTVASSWAWTGAQRTSQIALRLIAASAGASFNLARP